MKFSATRQTAMVRFLAALLVFVFYISGAHAQVANPDTPDAGQSGSQRQKDTDSPWVVQQKRDMEKKRNLARQQDIQKDTDRLLELATELKQYVDKTNQDILSMDVIKKAEEIEKLARNVKDKMKAQ